MGFWNNMKDVVHMNEFISRGTSGGTGANADTGADLYFFLLRSDRKLKYVYFKNVFEDTLSGYLRELLPNFGQ